MARFSRQRLTGFIRGSGVRQLRIACGLVRFAHLVSDFLNHAHDNRFLAAVSQPVMIVHVFGDAKALSVLVNDLQTAATERAAAVAV